MLTKNSGEGKARKSTQSWSINGKEFLNRIIIVVILAVSISLLNCDLREEPDSAMAPAVTLKGRVKDARTNLGMPDASVKVTGGAAAITDAQGHYEIRVPAAGAFYVTASMKGYSSATAIATVSEFSAVISEIALTQLEEPVVVGPKGGVIKIDVPGWNPDVDECLIILDIPEGALETEAKISLTHLVGFGIPELPEGYVSIVTVICEPEGIRFRKPAKMTVPLPCKSRSGFPFPLFYFRHMVWENTGKTAIVGSDGLTANTEKAGEILELGTYSVMAEAKIEIEFEEPVLYRTVALPEGVEEYTYIAPTNLIDSSEYPTVFAENLVGQVTRISFSEPVPRTDPRPEGIEGIWNLELYKETIYLRFIISGLGCWDRGKPIGAVIFAPPSCDPAIFLSCEEARVGEPVVIECMGFSSEEPVKIYFGDKLIFDGIADSLGSIRVDYDIPEVSSGEYSMRVVGLFCGEAMATIIIAPHDQGEVVGG